MSMPTAPAADARRAEVERWLHAIVSAGFAVPAAATAGVRRCLGARLAPVTERVAEPVRVIRSIIELVAGTTPVRGTEAAPDATAATDSSAAEEPAAPAAGAAVSQLPIDQYESLAASQVVARLENLTAEDLEAVRRFELSNRGRRTVISAIDQLLAARDAQDAG
jgi:hypothetical protein